MTVDKGISLSIVSKELEGCRESAADNGWDISPIDEEGQVFKVRMRSLVDREEYIVKVKFDNYKEYPLFIEFVDPTNGAEGTKTAYPQSDDNFFHSFPCICHPCSRKAYNQIAPGAPHGDWQLAGWQQNQGVGSLKSINWILRAIQARINDPTSYKGRMKG